MSYTDHSVDGLADGPLRSVSTTNELSEGSVEIGFFSPIHTVSRRFWEAKGTGMLTTAPGKKLMSSHGNVNNL